MNLFAIISVIYSQWLLIKFTSDTGILRPNYLSLHAVIDSAFINREHGIQSELSSSADHTSQLKTILSELHHELDSSSRPSAVWQSRMRKKIQQIGKSSRTRLRSRGNEKLVYTLHCTEMIFDLSFKEELLIIQSFDGSTLHSCLTNGVIGKEFYSLILSNVQHYHQRYSIEDDIVLLDLK